MRRAAIPALALLSLLIPAGVLRADEIRLKDGTKIEGTIVGFESDSFRVETSYGFALIRKDKVADINITASKKDADSRTNSAASFEAAAPVESPVAPAAVKQPATPNHSSQERNGTPRDLSSSSAGIGSTPSSVKADLAAPKA